MVAEAIVSDIKTHAGQRPFQTVVDKMGMGDYIEKYNEHLDQVTRSILSAFGSGQLLTLKT